jgi:flagellar FliJ protein
MKKFKFRLEIVLKQREIIEKLALKKYHDLKKKLEAEKLKALKAREQFQTLQKEFSIKQTGENKGLMAGSLLDYHYHLAYLDEKIGYMDKNISMMERDLKNVQQTLLHSAQNRKIIQRLKERAFQEYQDEAQRAEDKFWDELNTMRAAVMY